MLNTPIVNVDLPVVHDNGMFISAKISRIVELIRDYDSNLDVKFVPAERRGPNDAAFMITERLRDGREVVAFYVQSECDFDEDVLAKVYESDNAKHDVQSVMESKNKAARAVQAARHQEELDAHYDLTRSMIVSKKHTYRHDGKKYDL
jgi:hypothetical protein